MVLTRLPVQTSARDNEPAVRRRLRSTSKQALAMVMRAPPDRRRVLLIFGCQRSGTTMLQQTFLDRSRRILILDEHDNRLGGDDPERLRWRSLPEVAAQLRRFPFELVVAKPLVESHRVLQILDALPAARAIWLLRSYRDVALSNVRRFGLANGFDDIRRVIQGSASDWRRAGASDHTIQTLADFRRLDLTSLDAAALFWWARNRLFYEQNLQSDRRVLLLRYEDLLCEPDTCLGRVTDHGGFRHELRSPAKRIRGNGRPPVTLSAPVEALCAELWSEFGKLDGDVSDAEILIEGQQEWRSSAGT
jgi:Sulfotransferase domain